MEGNDKRRSAAGRGVLRVSTSVLLALSLLCLLAPFVTVGCDKPANYSGTSFIEGDSRDLPRDQESGGQDGEDNVLGSGAAPVTLAVVFAALGIVAALLPGLAASATAYGAALVTAGGFFAFLLGGSLRGIPSAFLDYRYGFWAALALSSAAALAAWRRWDAFPRVVTGAPVLTGFGGVVTLMLAALVAPGILGNSDSAPDILRRMPLTATLAPGVRRDVIWDVGRSSASRSWPLSRCSCSRARPPGSRLGRSSASAWAGLWPRSRTSRTSASPNTLPFTTARTSLCSAPSRSPGQA
jgi:hypothetical protein